VLEANDFSHSLGRKLMFEFAEPKNAIEGIADADFFGLASANRGFDDAPLTGTMGHKRSNASRVLSVFSTTAFLSSLRKKPRKRRNGKEG
jgi:hypothetical protein